MKHTWIVLLLIVGLGAAWVAPRSSDAAPNDAIDAWTQSLVAGDLDRMLTHYDASDDVMIIHSSGTVSHGREAVSREYAEAFREVTFQRAAFEPTHVAEDADVAWATGRFLATTQFGADGSLWNLEIYTSFVMQRQDGVWRIVLEQSTPIDGVPRLQRAP